MKRRRARALNLINAQLRRAYRRMMKVVDPKQSFSYHSGGIPRTYRCSRCGAYGCKLWRDYQTFLCNQALQCARCAAAEQGKDISTIDATGKRLDDDGSYRTDQIGWCVPAVPTEENNTFWGYTSVPPAGCDWWRKLPTHPVQHV